jgi:hypothetical protein
LQKRKKVTKLISGIETLLDFDFPVSMLLKVFVFWDFFFSDILEMSSVELSTVDLSTVDLSVFLDFLSDDEKSFFPRLKSELCFESFLAKLSEVLTSFADPRCCFELEKNFSRFCSDFSDEDSETSETSA